MELLEQEIQNIEIQSQDVEKNVEEVQEELIGYGISSDVYLVKDSKNKHLSYVLKKFNSQYPQSDIQNEGEIMQKLNKSQHVIQLYEIKQSQLAIEYATNGDLYQYVRRVRFSETLARTFFVQLVDGMNFMHREQNIAHMDIKLDNLLLSKEYQLKIADFGWATQYKGNQLLCQRAGTEGMFPPEMIEYKPYAPQKVDCFLCGIVLFTMVCGMSPITSKAKKTDKIYKYFANNMSHKLWKALKDKKGVQVSEDFKNLIEQMISYNFKQRPTFEEILQHNWVKKGEIYNNKEELIKEMDTIKKQFKAVSLKEYESQQDESKEDV